jgi:hypothetical protein
MREIRLAPIVRHVGTVEDAFDHRSKPGVTTLEVLAM